MVISKARAAVTCGGSMKCVRVCRIESAFKKNIGCVLRIVQPSGLEKKVSIWCAPTSIRTAGRASLKLAVIPALDHGSYRPKGFGLGLGLGLGLGPCVGSRIHKRGHRTAGLG